MTPTAFKWIRSSLFTFIAYFIFPVLFAQTGITQREIINYDKHQYNGGTQNWKIRQDALGRMYFANNEGLLVFDGKYWQLYPLPNKTIVRSLEFQGDKLFVGGQDEIGFFTGNVSGKLSYQSLLPLIPHTEQKFSDVWEIINYQGEMFFRSSTNIFRLINNKVIPYPGNWSFMGIHSGKLIAFNKAKGLMEFRDNDWYTLMEKNKLPDDILITSCTPMSHDSSLVTTLKNGIYIWAFGKFSTFNLTGNNIDNHQIFSNAIKLNNREFIIGTYTNGVYRVNSSGRVTEVLSEKDGIQNANVRAIFLDQNQNLWLGLDNGIDLVLLNNAIKKINPDIFKNGGGYSMAFFDRHVYFGLSTGIYQSELHDINAISETKNDIHQVSTGQCWNLSVVDNNIFCGKEDGIYSLFANSLHPIDNTTGFWNFQKVKANPSIFAAGNYSGVKLFSYQNNSFYNLGAFKNFKESSRYLIVDSNQYIWVSHPYRGVYRIDLKDSSVKIYNEHNGLPSHLNNHIFSIHNKVVVATEKGVYKYQIKSDRFIPDADFKNNFGQKSLRYLKEDNDGNIWFVEDKNIGVLDHTSPNRLIYIPELKGKILSGFENVYPVNSENIFIGGDKGFYDVNLLHYKENIKPIKVYISLVKSTSGIDSIFFGGFSSFSENQNIQKNVPSLNHKWNSMHFEYSAPFYEKEQTIQYSYFLEGFDKSWSEWSKKTEKDYTNLPTGKFTFHVKARNQLNNESAETTFKINIEAAWYNNIYAYFVYFLLLASFFTFLFKFQETKHYKRQQQELIAAKLEYERVQNKNEIAHQLEMERREKELAKLTNEKLAAELEFKNSELASTAMNLVQKKEFLLKIKEELEHYNKTGKTTIDTADLKRIIKSLSEEKKLNEEWELFSIHFNKVQGDFLNILQSKYPMLKPHELKLCAYLRMNLSTKEIAQLMSISVRGVEISRYRLRKKLGIPTETNLFQFLSDVQRNETQS